MDSRINLKTCLEKLGGKGMKKISVFMMVLAMTFMFGGSVYADFNEGLVAYYPFNGNANDESGNGNDGS